MFWVTTAVLVALPVSFNTLSAAGNPQGSSIPVRFLENKEVSLNLYPSGFTSAAALVGTGINGKRDLYPLKRIVFLFANQGIRNTFFISPGSAFRDYINSVSMRETKLIELNSHNFEIAQDGRFSLPETYEKSDTSPQSAPGILPYAQRLSKIKADREYLASLNLEPAGFLDWVALPEGQFLSDLAHLGYRYYCGIGRAESLDKLEDLYYPRSFGRREMLKFIAIVDPITAPDNARRIFDNFKLRSGSLIFHSDLRAALEKANLEKFKKFISYLKRENAWICSLRELSAWWNTRRDVEIECRREDDMLVVTYHNPTGFSLKNARLIFKSPEDSPLYYRVENRKEIMSSQGKIPASGFVNVTLFSDGV